MDDFGVRNKALKVNPKNIFQISTPFIAFTNSIESPYIVVTKVYTNKIEIYGGKGLKKKFIETNEFFKTWDGICLSVSLVKASLIRGNFSNFFNHKLKQAVPFLLYFLTSLFFLLVVNSISKYNIYFSKKFIFFQSFLLNIGLIVTSLMLWLDYDSNNYFLKKLCKTNAICKDFLNKNVAKWLGDVKWSEIGIVYFMGGLLLIILSNSLNNVLIVVASLNIIALPFVIYSLYYQSVIEKKWCFLCAIILVLLVLGGINTFANFPMQLFHQLSFGLIVKSSICYIISGCICYVIRPVILKEKFFEEINREFSKLKYDSEIFELLLTRQKSIKTPFESLGINIGGDNDLIKLILISNPYCKACSNLHLQIESLLDRFPDLSVKVIFIVEGDPESRLPVEYFLSMASKSDLGGVRNSMKEWFTTDSGNYKDFARNHLLESTNMNFAISIQKMLEWCILEGIRYTPTIFISKIEGVEGNLRIKYYQLPEIYRPKDLLYLLRGREY